MVANLAPRKMKFGLSEGMVLAASGDGPGIFLLAPGFGAHARHARQMNDAGRAVASDRATATAVRPCDQPRSRSVTRRDRRVARDRRAGARRGRGSLIYVSRVLFTAGAARRLAARRSSRFVAMRQVAPDGRAAAWPARSAVSSARSMRSRRSSSCCSAPRAPRSPSFRRILPRRARAPRRACSASNTTLPRGDGAACSSPTTPISSWSRGRRWRSSSVLPRHHRSPHSARSAAPASFTC